jgi:hypothetical protein
MDLFVLPMSKLGIGAQCMTPLMSICWWLCCDSKKLKYAIVGLLYPF